jgi:hypothetical protein
MLWDIKNKFTTHWYLFIPALCNSSKGIEIKNKTACNSSLYKYLYVHGVAATKRSLDIMYVFSHKLLQDIFG